MRSLLCLLTFALVAAAPAFALEHVTLRQDGREIEVAGHVLVTAEDGGILLMARDGMLWNIEPADLVAKRENAEPFVPLAREELAEHLLRDLPAGFEVLQTHHYLICYNTSRDYAAWCGALFERLYMAFTNFWSRKGMKLHEPEFPLVAIVFNSRESYVEHSQKELGKSAEAIVGYYSLRSNRITMYDLTGLESLRTAGGRRGSSAQINRVLAEPAAEQVVATIVHEATHQIAFNSGMQTRFADIPLWVSEGLAVYFETPDLQSAKGWRTDRRGQRAPAGEVSRVPGHAPSRLAQVTDLGRYPHSHCAHRARRLCRSLGLELLPHSKTSPRVSRLPEKTCREETIAVGQFGGAAARISSLLRRPRPARRRLRPPDPETPLTAAYPATPLPRCSIMHKLSLGSGCVVLRKLRG